MLSTHDDKSLLKKDIPVFERASISAMGPAAQGMAKILSDAGWITIIDQPSGGAS